MNDWQCKERKVKIEGVKKEKYWNEKLKCKNNNYGKFKRKTYRNRKRRK